MGQCFARRRIGWTLFLGLMTVAPVRGVAVEPRRDRLVILLSLDGLANYYLDDPRADMPTLRKLMTEGVRADSMVAVFPTVTWPNHTSLVTGVEPAKHGVLGNSVVDRRNGEKLALILDPLFDKDEIVLTPTIYDAAFNAGLKTAAVSWPATRRARTLPFCTPDSGADDYYKYATPAWLAELRRDQIPVDQYGAWFKDTMAGGMARDWLATRLARHVLEKHAPNLLLLHLIELDHLEHRHGPRTANAYWGCALVDRCLRDLLDAIVASPMRDKTTLLVVSDHGFLPIRREIRPNVALKELGLVEADRQVVTRKLAWAHAEGGAAAIHILDDDNRESTATKIVEFFGKIEGMEKVIREKDFASIGQATRSENKYGADLWLAAKSGFSFSDSVEGDDEVVNGKPDLLGTHGYLPDQPDLHAMFVAWGADVPRGVRIGKLRNLDIAPTIAKLLNVPFPTADGKPIKEIGPPTP